MANQRQGVRELYLAAVALARLLERATASGKQGGVPEGTAAPSPMVRFVGVAVVASCDRSFFVVVVLLGVGKRVVGGSERHRPSELRSYLRMPRLDATERTVAEKAVSTSSR